MGVFIQGNTVIRGGAIFGPNPSTIPGFIDTSFNTGSGFNGTVYSLALQSDGKILAGGTFTQYSGITSNLIIRLNSDGSKDNSFTIGSGFNSNVLDLGIQSDGKILVGGNFTSYSGISINRIIRLNSNGSKDDSFIIGTGFNNLVNVIIIQSDGKILVGGGYTSYSGITANRIIRLNSDGSKDDSFINGTGFNAGSITSMALQPDGKILIGGSFTQYSGITANRIIRLNSDGSKDDSFSYGSGSNNFVQGITVQSDGKILITGQFTQYSGISASGIIRLNSDGSKDNSFSYGSGFFTPLVGGTNTWVSKIDNNGKILISGAFSSYNGVGASRIIRLNSDGSKDNSFITDGFIGNTFPILIQSDSKILVGGNFTGYNTSPINYLVRLIGN